MGLARKSRKCIASDPVDWLEKLVNDVAFNSLQASSAGHMLNFDAHRMYTYRACIVSSHFDV